jgi:Mrp family chromosome partitioning ATPase
MGTLTVDTPTISRSPSTIGGPVSENYQSLVHWLRAVGDVSNVSAKAIGVTSCSQGAGATTVAVNLALAGAQAGENVLLVDFSSTRPAIAARLGLSGELGLRDAVADVTHAAEYVTATPLDKLSVLAANLPGEPQSINLDAASINGLLRAVESEYSLIVVDLPTVESSLCFIASGLLNGVLLVMEAERTRIDVAARAKQRLIDARASVLGVILNKSPQHLPSWLEARL